MQTHLDVINLWPSPLSLACDLPEPVKASTVRYWKREGHIPPHRFDDVLAAAKKRGFRGVTYPLLAAGARQAEAPSAGEKE